MELPGLSLPPQILTRYSKHYSNSAIHFQHKQVSWAFYQAIGLHFHIPDLPAGLAPVPEGYRWGNDAAVHVPTSSGCSGGCTGSKEIIKSHWPAETKLDSKRKTNNRQEATGNQAWRRKAALGGTARFPLTSPHHSPGFFPAATAPELNSRPDTAPVRGSVSSGANSPFPSVRQSHKKPLGGTANLPRSPPAPTEPSILSPAQAPGNESSPSKGNNSN